MSELTNPKSLDDVLKNLLLKGTGQRKIVTDIQHAADVANIQVSKWIASSRVKGWGSYTTGLNIRPESNGSVTIDWNYYSFATTEQIITKKPEATRTIEKVIGYLIDNPLYVVRHVVGEDTANIRLNVSILSEQSKNEVHSALKDKAKESEDIVKDQRLGWEKVMNEIHWDRKNFHYKTAERHLREVKRESEVAREKLHKFEEVLGIRGSNPFPVKTKSTKTIKGHTYFYAGRTQFLSKAKLELQILVEQGIGGAVTQKEGWYLLWTRRPVWVDLSEPLYNPRGKKLTIKDFNDMELCGRDWRSMSKSERKKIMDLAYMDNTENLAKADWESITSNTQFRILKAFEAYFVVRK